jgi:putative Mn2+ efflux pump MntP
MEIVLLVALIVMTIIATVGWGSALIFRRAWKKVEESMGFLATLGQLAAMAGLTEELQEKQKPPDNTHLDDILNDPKLN